MSEMKEYEKYFLIPLEKRNTLGKFINKMRRENNLTLTQLSEKSNISPPELHKIEHSAKSKISPFQLKLLGRALDIDYKILYVIVGFLEEEDFGENKSYVQKIIENNKNENIENDQLVVFDFKRDILDDILDKCNNKLSSDELEKLRELLNSLKKEEITSWLQYGGFIKSDVKGGT